MPIDQFALQPAALEPSRVRLAALDLQLAERERELAREKTELHELQSRYLREIGGLYEQLAKLQAAVEEAEIRAGIRPPVDDDAASEEEDDNRRLGGGSRGRLLESAPVLRRPEADVPRHREGDSSGPGA